MNADNTGWMPPPLSPAVVALLAHERIFPSQPEMVRARALARALKASREAPVTMPAPRVAPASGRRFLLAAAAAITLMAGAAAAFQMLARPATTPPQNLATARITQQLSVVPSSAEPEHVPNTAKQDEPMHTTPAVAAAFSSAKASGPNRRSLVASRHGDGQGNGQGNRMEELQLLSRARQSDARGNYAEVLALVAEHERSYPAGRLSEEREVLRVKALVGLARGAEARHAAAKFRRRFPHSVLLPKIDDMLASLQ